MFNDSKYLEHIEYRCALVADKMYELGDLSDVGIFAASPEQIHRIFGNSKILFHDTNGFQAKLYHDFRSDQFILGFGGTHLDNTNDWITNFNQFFGQQSDHYIQGLELVNKIRDDSINKIIVTGHSLGGGIATLAAVARKLQGCVFNSPAIHRNILEQFDDLHLTSAEDKIKRFVVAGEILDLINKTISVQHHQIGTKIQLYGSWRIPILSGLIGRQLLKMLVPNPAVVFASMVGLPLLQKSFELHRMNEVIHGLKTWLGERKHEIEIGNFRNSES
jgi:hypothetical protein